MKNDWILDVLADLKTFATANGMPALAEQLAETAELAAVEISNAEGKADEDDGDAVQIGNYLRAVGDG